jgi:hypothetical protein
MHNTAFEVDVLVQSIVHWGQIAAVNEPENIPKNLSFQVPIVRQYKYKIFYLKPCK